MKHYHAMRYIFLLLSLFFSSHIAWGYHFRNYQVKDGLSHNSVWAVMQDHKGFMWFGTNDGLNRFDGKDFKIFRKIKGDSLSIGNNFIHCLKENSRGRLLVGTKQGLYVYNEKTENFIHVDLGQKDKDDASINSIMEDPAGNFWLACHGYGLYLLSPDLKVKKHYLHKDNSYSSLPTNYIWSLVQDDSCNIWLGTVGYGLVRLSPKDGKFVQIPQIAGGDAKGMVIYSLYRDIDNNIWIGTSDNGLIRYTPKSGIAVHYMPGILNIKSIIEYSDHELIMGSDKGLVTFDRVSGKYVLINEESVFDNMSDNSIFSIVRDREGAFWIGTYFGGVNYFSPAINRFQYYYNVPLSNSQKKNIISCFAEGENGNVWVGTHDDGLYLFNHREQRFKKPFHVGYHDVQSILLDGNKLYMGLYGKGIMVLDVRSGRVLDLLTEAFPDHMQMINSIFKTSEGNLLFASENGVTSMNSAGAMERLDKLKGVPVKGIAETYDGSIWFATHTRGLMRMDAHKRWEVFMNRAEDSTSIPGNNVNCVFQDMKYRVWAGTEGEELALFNAKKKDFEVVLDDKCGLPSNIIYSILNDAEGNLWVSTGGGLAKISPDLKSIKTYTYINEIQQIQYNVNCALRSSDNHLYFGGTNGFITFNPAMETDNQVKPVIMITELKIDNRVVTPSDEDSPLEESITQTQRLVLNHNQSTFGFKFVSLRYQSPKQNRYAYMLEGVDKSWNYTNDGSVSYMNIPPSNYVFRVKGTNNDGIWSNEASIAIRINPPLWKSIPMLCLYILLAIAFVAYFVLRYYRLLERKNKEKIFKYQVAKEKEMYELKIIFFTNIAHEIRTPLSLIVAPLEKVILSGDGTEQTKSNLKMIERNANRLLELVNQLLDFRKIEENMFHFNFKKQNIVKVVRKVYMQYSQNAKFNKLDISLDVEAEDMECNMDSESVYKILSNLIANAIKYARTRIDITVRTSEGNILVAVRDNGNGIEEKFTERIFEPFFQVQDKDNAVRSGSGLGLSLSQSLAVKHGGKISVESEYGHYCCFTFSLPALPAGETVAEAETEVQDLPAPEPVETNTGTRVLVVEDNPDMLAFLCENLGDDYEVFRATKGVEALSVVEKENVDVIISDIMMPEMDGLELCSRLKTNMAYSHLPLIILSAKTDTSTKVDSMNKGADVYMDKPFSIEQLKAQVNSIIENRNHIQKKIIESPLLYLKRHTENNESTKFVRKLNDVILKNMSDEKFSIDGLSELFAICRSNLHKKIKNITGMTPNDYIKLVRLNESARLLSTGKYKINEVCYLVGFNTPSYFSKCFFEHFGKLPKDFIQTK
ncbi:MAG: response regulator [Paraprevotella sp.]|nr:response regulator [Paraprevotella sp.]